MREHFLPYDLREFTDTNSVICKIIVGADAHIRPRVDVGIDPYEMSVKEKDIESNRNCSSGGGMRYNNTKSYNTT